MAKMSLLEARTVLNQARADGWCVRPSLHSDRVWVAERSTFKDARRIFGAGEIGLALLLQQRALRPPRPPRSDRRDEAA